MKFWSILSLVHLFSFFCSFLGTKRVLHFTTRMKQKHKNYDVCIETYSMVPNYYLLVLNHMNVYACTKV